MLIAFRYYLKNRFTRFLNLSGFTIGIFGLLSISMFIYHEWSFDKHIYDVNRIYRVTTNWQSHADAESINLALSLTPLSDYLLNTFPEVEAATGLSKITNKVIVENDNSRFYEQNIYETDPYFFDVFKPDILYGSITDLGPTSIVLTKSLAKKYFSEQDPTQKILLVNDIPYQIAAVIHDLPKNSSYRYDALIFTLETYSVDWCFNFIKVIQNADIKNLELNIKSILNEENESFFAEKQSSGYYKLEKLTDIHLSETQLFDVDNKGDRKLNIALAFLFFLILIITLINYINLNTVIIFSRQREVGLKRIFGASFWYFNFQFSIELFIELLFGLLLSMLVIYFGSVFLTDIDWLKYSIKSMEILWPIITVVLVLLVSSIIIGNYISYLIVRKPIANSLKQNLSFRDNPLLRNTFLIIQFTAAVTLIYMSFVVNNQIDNILSKSKNINFESILVLDLPIDTSSKPSYELLRNVLAELPFINSVSFLGEKSLPTSDPEYDLFAFNVNGELKIMTIPYVRVDEKFFSLMNMDFIAGKAFDEVDQSKRSWNSPIVNESFIKNYGWEVDPLSHIITYAGTMTDGGKIVGVVKDFGFNGLHRSPKPMIYYPLRGYYEKLLIRLTSIDENKLGIVKSIWEENVSQPFEYIFLHDYYSKAIESEKRFQEFIGLLSLLSVFIASIGLFGLINLSFTKSKQSIAIRSIYGAGFFDFIKLLMRKYFVPVIISIILSYPLGAFIVSKWLENYPEKASLYPISYVPTLVVSIILFLVCICYSFLRYQSFNSLKWLRNES